MDAEPSLNDLRDALRQACQQTDSGAIVQGRQRVLDMPRAWVLTNVFPVAEETLDLADFWEYRRLLELCELLDAGLLQRFVTVGLGSTDPDVQLAAEDFKR